MLRKTLLFTFALLILVFYLQNIGLESDTSFLIQQTHASLSCLAQGQWSGCIGGGSYPLLEKIPAAVFVLLGFRDGMVIRLLASLSLLASIGLAWLGIRSLRRRSDLAPWIFSLVLICGPFLWYARSSFSEALAAGFTLAFLVSCRENWSASKRVSLLILASLAKETAAPFLAVLGLMALFLRKDRKQALTSAEIAQLAAGAGAGVALSILHNFFRFGTWTNQSYLNPTNVVQELGTHLNFFFALLFAPNGGLLFFWPLAMIVLLYPLFAGKRPASLIAFHAMLWAVLLGLLVGFSKWAFPFGWNCWGPRFLIPWIPSLIYLALSAEPRIFEEKLESLSRKSVLFAALLAAIAFSSFPHASALFNRELVDWLFLPDSVCPRLPVIEENKAYYLSCIRYFAWAKPSILLKSFDVFFHPLAFALSCLFVAGQAFFLIRMRGMAMKSKWSEPRESS